MFPRCNGIVQADQIDPAFIYRLRPCLKRRLALPAPQLMAAASVSTKKPQAEPQPLSLSDTHNLLRSLLPAVQAIVTISDLTLVHAVMRLIQGPIMALICPLVGVAACAASRPEQEPSLSHDGLASRSLLEDLVDKHFKSSVTKSADSDVQQAALEQGAAESSFMASLVHLQLVGLEASGSLLGLLLPLIACFQVRFTMNQYHGKGVCDEGRD